MCFEMLHNMNTLQCKQWDSLGYQMHVHMCKLVCAGVWLCATTKVISVGCLGLMAGDVGLGLTRSTNEAFDNNFIPFHQHSADEHIKVFEFASVNVHVVTFVFD